MGALIPDGRVLIDTRQSFNYREGGLSGILLGSRLTGLSPNMAARYTSGTLISTYEVYEALQEGIAVPYRKSDPERVRKFDNLRACDRGGMMFQPVPGLYGAVYQNRFLFPVSLGDRQVQISPPRPSTILNRRDFFPGCSDPCLPCGWRQSGGKGQNPGLRGSIRS